MDLRPRVLFALAESFWRTLAHLRCIFLAAFCSLYDFLYYYTPCNQTVANSSWRYTITFHRNGSTGLLKRFLVPSEGLGTWSADIQSNPLVFSTFFRSVAPNCRSNSWLSVYEQWAEEVVRGSLSKGWQKGFVIITLLMCQRCDLFNLPVAWALLWEHKSQYTAWTFNPERFWTPVHGNFCYFWWKTHIYKCRFQLRMHRLWMAKM